jgi:adenylate kinase family enzyme
VRRIWVVGTSGSGESTLARAISERTGACWVELDALFHQANWTPLPTPEFRAAVEEKIAAGSWVVDGNYTGSVGDLVLTRADTVVWLDLHRHVVMRQIVWRTVRRILIREELWNGNRERLRNFFSLDKKQSVIVWAWVTHRQNRRRFLAAQPQPAYQGLRFVRLRSRRQVDEFIDNLGD